MEVVKQVGADCKKDVYNSRSPSPPVLVREDYYDDYHINHEHDDDDDDQKKDPQPPPPELQLQSQIEEDHNNTNTNDNNQQQKTATTEFEFEDPKSPELGIKTFHIDELDLECLQEFCNDDKKDQQDMSGDEFGFYQFSSDDDDDDDDKLPMISSKGSSSTIITHRVEVRLERLSQSQITSMIRKYNDKGLNQGEELDGRNPIESKLDDDDFDDVGVISIKSSSSRVITTPSKPCTIITHGFGDLEGEGEGEGERRQRQRQSQISFPIIKKPRRTKRRIGMKNDEEQESGLPGILSTTCKNCGSAIPTANIASLHEHLATCKVLVALDKGAPIPSELLHEEEAFHEEAEVEVEETSKNPPPPPTFRISNNFCIEEEDLECTEEISSNKRKIQESGSKSNDPIGSKHAHDEDTDDDDDDDNDNGGVVSIKSPSSFQPTLPTPPRRLNPQQISRRRNLMIASVLKLKKPIKRSKDKGTKNNGQGQGKPLPIYTTTTTTCKNVVSIKSPSSIPRIPPPELPAQPPLKPALPTTNFQQIARRRNLMIASVLKIPVKEKPRANYNGQGKGLPNYTTTCKICGSTISASNITSIRTHLAACKYLAEFAATGSVATPPSSYHEAPSTPTTKNGQLKNKKFDDKQTNKKKQQQPLNGRSRAAAALSSSPRGDPRYNPKLKKYKRDMDKRFGIGKYHLKNSYTGVERRSARLAPPPPTPAWYSTINKVTGKSWGSLLAAQAPTKQSATAAQLPLETKRKNPVGRPKLTDEEELAEKIKRTKQSLRKISQKNKTSKNPWLSCWKGRRSYDRVNTRNRLARMRKWRNETEEEQKARFAREALARKRAGHKQAEEEETAGGRGGTGSSKQEGLVDQPECSKNTSSFDEESTTTIEEFPPFIQPHDRSIVDKFLLYPILKYLSAVAHVEVHGEEHSISYYEYYDCIKSWSGRKNLRGTSKLAFRRCKLCGEIQAAPSTLESLRAHLYSCTKNESKASPFQGNLSRRKRKTEEKILIGDGKVDDEEVEVEEEMSKLRRSIRAEAKRISDLEAAAEAERKEAEALQQLAEEAETILRLAEEEAEELTSRGPNQIKAEKRTKLIQAPSQEEENGSPPIQCFICKQMFKDVKSVNQHSAEEHMFM